MVCVTEYFQWVPSRRQYWITSSNDGFVCSGSESLITRPHLMYFMLVLSRSSMIWFTRVIYPELGTVEVGPGITAHVCESAPRSCCMALMEAATSDAASQGFLYPKGTLHKSTLPLDTINFLTPLDLSSSKWSLASCYISAAVLLLERRRLRSESLAIIVVWLASSSTTAFTVLSDRKATGGCLSADGVFLPGVELLDAYG